MADDRPEIQSAAGSGGAERGDDQAEQLSADPAADDSGDRFPHGSETHVLEDSAGDVSPDRAGDQLNDQGQHCSPSFAWLLPDIPSTPLNARMNVALVLSAGASKPPGDERARSYQQRGPASMPEASTSLSRSPPTSAACPARRGAAAARRRSARRRSSRSRAARRDCRRRR